MYSYFLSDYINYISVKDTRKLKELSKDEIAQIIMIIITGMAVIITTILSIINSIILDGKGNEYKELLNSLCGLS